MKTLRQIREDYDSKFVSLDTLSKQMMFEGSSETEGLSSPKEKDKKKIGRISPIPSSKEMPVMLMFRRLQYRVFPDHQVVALYYSNQIDKYLSIPFGPGGNLNLSEATVFDREQIEEELETAPKLTAEENFRIRLAEMRQARMDENWLTAGLSLANGAAGAVGKLAGTAIDVAKAAAKKVMNPLGANPNKLGQNKSGRPGSVGKSTWDKARPNVDATTQSKLRQADVARAKTVTQKDPVIAENKISDIRQMISEGIETKALHINGRTVTLNTGMAKRILEVYDSVNLKNKRIVESMINSDLETFKKLLNFSIKQ